MNIGIDIDGTLCDNFETVLNWATIYDREILKNNTKIQNVEFCEMIDIFKWTKQQETEFWNTYINTIAKTMPVKPFAKEVISKLRKEGYKIFIISGRTNNKYQQIEQITPIYLHDKKIQFDKMILNAQDKPRVCEDNKIDIYIEDQPQLCKDISKKIKVICMCNLYNKDFREQGIEMAYSWIEAYVLIHKISNNPNYNLLDFEN